MNAPSPPTTPSSPPPPPPPPPLPPLAQTFLTARLAAQSATLASLQTRHGSLSMRYEILKAQHPSLSPQISLYDMRAITRAANAETVAEVAVVEEDFDEEVGVQAGGAWVKEEVMERVRGGCGGLVLVRVDVQQLERLCGVFEGVVGRGAEREARLEDWGEVFRWQEEDEEGARFGELEEDY